MAKRKATPKNAAQEPSGPPPRLSIESSHRFERETLLLKKRGLNTQKLKDAILLLSSRAVLPENYRDHALTGNWEGFRECHIGPDWLLI